MARLSTCGQLAASLPSFCMGNLSYLGKMRLECLIQSYVTHLRNLSGHCVLPTYGSQKNGSLSLRTQ